MAERKWVVFPACEKCGATVPKAEWVWTETCRFTGDHHVGEHFHLTCWRCGFYWAVPIPPWEAKAE